MHKRAVVYPQGIPSRRAAADHCAELVALCGGDPDRQFERTQGTLAQFGTYLTRLPAFQHGHIEALVVMTHTRPVDLIVPTRRLLAKVPGLDRAVWLLFWDHMAHPDFPEQLSEFGQLEGPADDAPLWHPSQGGRPFLVLSTLATVEGVRARVGTLGGESRRVSEARRDGLAASGAGYR